MADNPYRKLPPVNAVLQTEELRRLLAEHAHEQVVSGAILREVGTTNITRLSDYERAVGPSTGALLQVHSSNYRISGFTESVPLADLVALGRKHNLPVIDDTGSGALID